MSKKRLVIFIIALVLIAGGVGYLVFHFVSQAKRNAVYEEIKPTETETTTEKQEEYHSPINFEELHQINEDIYSYISITDTDMQYPIVQGGPYEDYYLDHTIEHYEGYPGAIYTQMVNSKDYSDFNTIIYGHELNDGTMFTQLHNYWDYDYFNTHREIKIYLPDRELTYTVFAQVTYDDRLIPSYYDFSFPEERQKFLDSIYNNRYLSDIVADDIAVTEKDNIITLSTCIYNMPNNRCLILAVKTGETK